MNARAVLALGLLASSPAPAQPCFDYQTTTQPVGTIDIPSGNAALQMDRNATHLFAGDAGHLRVYEIGGSSTPVGEVAVPFGARYVAVSGTWAYASGPGGFTVVDVSDVNAPVVRGTVAGLDGRTCIAGSLALVAEGTPGLRIVDVSNPDVPVQAAAITATPADAVDVTGTLAFVAYASPGSVGGLLAYDVSIPGSPVPVTSIPGPSGPWGGDVDLTVLGSTVYLAWAWLDLSDFRHDGRTNVYDISTPATPTLTTSFGPPASRVSVGGGLAITTSPLGVVTTVDASTPLAPVVLSQVPIEGATSGDLGLDGRAFVAQSGTSPPSRILELALSTGAGPVVGTAASSGAVGDVCSFGSQLLAVRDTGFFSGWLDVFDTSGGVPSLVGSEPLSSDPFSLAADDQWAVVSGNTDASGDYPLTTVIDVSDPADPQTLLSTLDLAFGSGAAVADPWLYAAPRWFTGSSRIWQIGVDGSLTGRAYLPVTARRHLVSGNLLFCATASGLQIYDVTDPDVPTLEGSAGTMELLDIAFEGDRIFAVGGGTFHVFDVSNPSLPALVGSTPTYLSAGGVVAGGDFAYASGGGHGFEILDVTAPTLPASLGLGGSGEWGNRSVGTILGSAGDALFLFESQNSADAFGGGDNRRRTFPLQCASSVVGAPQVAGATLRLAPPFPNPFRESTSVRFGTRSRGPVELGVFDVTGRRVRSLISREAPSGQQSVTWDGRDATGRQTAAGVYFIRLRTPEGDEARAVVRMR